VDPSTGLDGVENSKSLAPTEVRTPHGSPHKELLYRPRHRGPTKIYHKVHLIVVSAEQHALILNQIIQQC
jgi:hypothetical protein